MDGQGMKMFYDVCRLCLDGRGVHNIFVNHELPEDIFACTGVRVKSSDHLPHSICNKCFETLNNAKELRKLATNNDNHLRLLFDDDNNSDSDGLGRLVIDETQTIETVLTSNGETKLISVNLIGEEAEPDSTESPMKAKLICVRKDLFPAVSKESSVPFDSSTKGNESIPKREKSETPRKNREVNGDKYVCQTCNKEFTLYKKLYLHERLHNKTLACPIDVCLKKFATKGDLVKHLRTHTGEKPFECDICSKRFAQRVTLRQHKETVHEGVVADDDDT